MFSYIPAVKNTQNRTKGIDLANSWNMLTQQSFSHNYSGLLGNFLKPALSTYNLVGQALTQNIPYIYFYFLLF